MEKQEPVLEIRDLHTFFPLEEGMLKAVNGVSLTIHKNRTLGVVGESGCGKSVTAQSILRIVPDFAQMTGEILLHKNGEVIDLAALAPSGREIRDIRGRDVSMIFQEPMTAFSPVHTVGEQIMEAILVHDDVPKAEARAHAIELLKLVGIPIPEERVDAYPHQLSGGMRQRAMIAMALVLTPMLLIADEPTTALDVTIQAQILRLMKTLQAEMGMSIMFITHDLGVIANMADDVAVMYLGRVVEYGSVRQIFRTPKHPYTQALLRSIPRTGRRTRVRLEAIEGIVPVPLDPPDICPFADRCTQFIPGSCDEKVPDFLEIASGHSVRCILYE